MVRRVLGSYFMDSCPTNVPAIKTAEERWHLKAYPLYEQVYDELQVVGYRVDTLDNEGELVMAEVVKADD